MAPMDPIWTISPGTAPLLQIITQVKLHEDIASNRKYSNTSFGMAAIDHSGPMSAFQ